MKLAVRNIVELYNILHWVWNGMALEIGPVLSANSIRTQSLKEPGSAQPRSLQMFRRSVSPELIAAAAIAYAYLLRTYIYIKGRASGTLRAFSCILSASHTNHDLSCSPLSGQRSSCCRGGCMSAPKIVCQSDEGRERPCLLVDENMDMDGDRQTGRGGARLDG